MSAAEEVARMELEAVQAASSAVVAEASAETALVAAAATVAQVTEHAANQIAEVKDDVRTHDGELEWMREKLIKMEANQTTMESQIREVLETTKSLLVASMSSIPEPAPALPIAGLNVDVADPLEVKAPEPKIQPEPEKKRHRLM